MVVVEEGEWDIVVSMGMHRVLKLVMRIARSGKSKG